MTDHERDDWGDDGELRPQLDAYADARLRPDPEASARVRSRVMAEARLVLEARRDVGEAPRRRLPFVMPRRPRLRFSLLAGAWLLVALMVAGGAVAASGPGGPLYAARLWAEDLTLPADADARARAQADHLEERLAEAERAARDGNGAAVTAALEAYRTTAGAALLNAGDDPARREHLATQLGRHVAVLEALAPLVPGRASEAIRAAVDRAESRIQEILAAPKPTPGKPEATPAGPDRTPPAKPEATPAGPDRTPPAKPEATPAGPDRTPPGKPEATPKPTPAGPDRTPPGKPEATPKPPKTPAP
jgi:DNA polymerase-3 subunit gamma/tau